MKIIFLFLSVSLYASSHGTYSVKEEGFYLSHFDQVGISQTCFNPSPGQFFRGGAPIDDMELAMKKFVNEKIDFVVDLRTENPTAKKTEEDKLSRIDIDYLNLPLTTSNDVDTMKIHQNLDHQVTNKTMDTTSAVNYVIELMINYANQGKNVYVHCTRGEDRTGLIIALARTLQKNCVWNKEFRSYGGVMYDPLQTIFDNVQKTRNKKPKKKTNSPSVR